MLLSENIPHFEDCLASYVEAAGTAGGTSLAPELCALIRVAVTLTVPSMTAAKNALEVAKNAASDEQISGAVAIAAMMRAGAATAYGRLVFKYIGDARSGEPRPDRAFMEDLRAANPDLFKTWQAFMGAAHGASSLSEKEEELIAIACAAVSRCVYCLEVHGRKAEKAGASAQEIGEAVHLAIAHSAEAALMDFALVSSELN